jgi:Transcription factor TFIID (or TATA-binding protein, TBP)
MEAPVLSTMVVLYNTNLTLDTTMLLHSLPLNSEIIKIEKRGIMRRGESKRDRIRRRSKKEVSAHNNTGFCHNSITLVMMNNGGGQLPMKEITVKVFQNGVFHMTGVLDERYDSFTIQSLLTTIWGNCQESLKNPPHIWEITKRRVVLMNYITNLISKSTVQREPLHTTIRALNLENIKSHYDPDVYPAVKINIGPQKWTAKIFRTGKIILTGVTSAGEIEFFMSSLLSLFERAMPQTLRLGNTSNTVAQLLTR